MLITGNFWFGNMAFKGSRTMTWDEFNKIHLAKIRARFQIKEAGMFEDEPPLGMIVNHGTWYVKCPDCNGFEYAWEEGVFFCTSCKNSKVGHKYRRSAFPEDRDKIEAILNLRPFLNRNWNWPKTETVADLEAENLEHAAELLEGGNG